MKLEHFLPWREEPGGGVPYDQNNLKMRRQRTMLGCKRMLAYVVMRSRMCPGFQVSSGASIDIYTMTGVPMMLSRGTNPQYLLSYESSRLSPIMKYSPAGTVTGP